MFYGTESSECLTERLKTLSHKVEETKLTKAEQITFKAIKSRQISFMLLFLNHVTQANLRREILKKVKLIFKQMEYWTIGDLFLMREVALMGEKTGLLNKIVTEGEDDLAQEIESEAWDDILVMLDSYQDNSEAIKSYEVNQKGDIE